MFDFLKRFLADFDSIFFVRSVALCRFRNVLYFIFVLRIAKTLAECTNVFYNSIQKYIGDGKKFVKTTKKYICSFDGNFMTKYDFTDCTIFFQFSFMTFATLWKLQNFTATIFSQKFREINFLLKKT